MSSITPSPIGPATAARRGTQSAADKSKLDAINSTGTNTGDVTLDAASSSWLTLVGQALKLTLVSAAGATAGLVDGFAQAWNGVKTFAAEAIFSAGLVATGVRAIGAALMLRSDLGAGASDVAVKIGPSTLDGAVNATAKIASFGTGNDGTNYVESLNMLKGGRLAGGVAYINLSTASGATVAYSTNSSIGVGVNIIVATTGYWAAGAAGWSWNTSTGADILNGLTRSFRSDRGGTAGQVALKSGTSVADGAVSPTAYLHQFITGSGGTEVVKAQISTGGEWEQLVAGSGVILKSPDGTRYRITVANGGTLAIAAA